MKLRELEKRLKLEPDNLGLRVAVAGLMREAGRSVEAVELYRSVALAYRDQDRTQQAIAVCRSILEIAPEDAACQGLLGALQQRTTGQHPAQRTTGERAAVSPAPANPASAPRIDETPMPRRSSLDETPLPRPVPSHVVDPTSQPYRISASELNLPSVEGADTRPGGSDDRPAVTGLAQAARRISGLISDTHGMPSASIDLAAEVETRQRPRISTEQVRKLDTMPDTSPIGRVPISRDSESDLKTEPRAALPRLRPSDDALTPPPKFLLRSPGGHEDEQTTPGDHELVEDDD